MNQKSKKTMLRIIMMSVLVTGLFIVSANPAMARTRGAFFLYVVNGDTVPVTVKFNSWSCYGGGTPDGQIFKNVAPGKRIAIHAKRNQGSACDGKQGYFKLTFDPKANGNELAMFDFSNDGDLNVTNIANPYTGRLTKIDNRDYLFRTAISDKITPGVSVGSWKFLCAVGCQAYKTTTSVTDRRSTERTEIDSTRKALSLSMEAGIKLKKVFEMKTKIATEFETTHSEEMSTSIMKMSFEEKVMDMSKYTTEWMTENGVKGMWQWEVSTELTWPDGKKENVKTKTHFLTCTSTAKEPGYYPGSQEHLDACRKE